MFSFDLNIVVMNFSIFMELLSLGFFWIWCIDTCLWILTLVFMYSIVLDVLIVASIFTCLCN